MLNKATGVVITAVVMSVFFVSSSSADSVRLRSNDGSVDVIGNLISYENELFKLGTSIGPLLLSAKEYTCSGLECPTIDVPRIEAVKPAAKATNVFVRVN